MQQYDPDIKYGPLRKASIIREWEEGASPASKSTLTQQLGQTLMQYRQVCQTELFWPAAQCFLFMWAMDDGCEIFISYEEIVAGEAWRSAPASLLRYGHPRRRGFPCHPSDERKLGHPTLLGGGMARVAGELFLDVHEDKLQWFVSCGSGRYCREQPPNGEQQKQIHQLFMGLIDDQVRFDAI